MRFNDNDYKYIVKRVIVYVIIGLITFFGASQCAKAQVLSYQLTTGSSVLSPSQDWITEVGITLPTNVFSSAGQGELIGSFVVTTSGTPFPFIKGVDVRTNTSIYQCDIGTMLDYKDTIQEYAMITFRCPMEIYQGGSLRSINIQGNWKTQDVIRFGNYISYVLQGSNGSQEIINATTSSFNSIIANVAQGNAQAHLDAENIINSVNTATQQEVNAINNNTQAINDLNDTINADFEFNSDWTGQLNVFGDDTNIFVTIVTFPFNILRVLMGTVENSTCQPILLGNLLGTSLVMPCINIQSIIGSTIYNTIDTIFGMVIIFGVVLYLKKLFEYVMNYGESTMQFVEVFK